MYKRGLPCRLYLMLQHCRQSRVLQTTVPPNLTILVLINKRCRLSSGLHSCRNTVRQRYSPLEIPIVLVKSWRCSLCPFPLLINLSPLLVAIRTCSFPPFFYFFNASFRIAVASGIWNAGDVSLKTIRPCNNFFESSLERLLLVERDARREEQVCPQRVLCITLSLPSPSAVKQAGVGAVAGCGPRGNCKTQEQVRCPQLNHDQSEFLQLPSARISRHILCSVGALKDREERFRLHLNRQFETLSDAKNIEEQVSSLCLFFEFYSSADPCL